MSLEVLKSFGERLKAARDTMGFSPQEAASRLNLSPRFIHALEEEDLQASTLPPIYLRGYLRSYARLVKISETDINAVLEHLAPTPVILTSVPTTPDVIPAASIFENNPLFVRFGTFVVSIVLLASVTTWWYLHSSAPTTAVIALNPPGTSLEENINSQTVTPIINNVTTALAKPTDQLTAPAPTQLALAPSQKSSSRQDVVPSHEEDENTDE